MSKKIKGTDTLCKEWWKHLRKKGKRAFWSSVRNNFRSKKFYDEL